MAASRPREPRALGAIRSLDRSYSDRNFVKEDHVYVRDDVLVADPFGRPNAGLVVAAARAGALGVLDLTAADDPTAVVADVTARTDERWAAKVEPGTVLELPGSARTVVLAGAAPVAAAKVAAWPDRQVLVEVTSIAEAEAALAAGASGLLVKGCEAGGRAGEMEGFVLAQQVRGLGLPWWLASGVGLRTAGVARAAGAAGVVLSDALALVAEVRPGLATAAALAAMDGTETMVIAGRRVWSRPGSPAAALAARAAGGVGTGGVGTGGDIALVRGAGADDVRTGLVSAGSDTAMAGRLADRFGTAGGVIAAIRASSHHRIATAFRHPPLRPANHLASRHRLRYPVAQGPMTRVSDRPAFAAAVAEGGGLPFVALALLNGPEARNLLTETAEALGDRAWGVGILGFVPPEVRQAQLEVVHEIHPPVALIAGGRPSQARGLEEAGVATFIHVPSPGLLEQFLAQGARRFVFEGRECGGHVGPRSSLALWEAQLAVLEQREDVSDLEVLLAGGIHDATSAAMASTVLATLAERGAGVGVLMGSAYLFCAEAVDAGAVASGYQRAAIEGRGTVLLETSPGHATRCLDSSYVRAFAARKDELAAAGTEPGVMWAELEQLNLGRLRIASKQVTRTPEGIVPVDDAMAAAEGMYMIGQVATLRHETTTVAQLHREVTVHATAVLEEAARTGAAPDPVRRPGPLDIAIVGMAGVFPQAADVEEFWANVVSGRDAVVEVPAARWDSDRYYDPDPARGGRRTPSRWGGFIPAVGFDPLAYGIPPASLAAIEPVQLLALLMAERALADAGYARRPFNRERASVIFGAEGGTDLQGAYNFRSLADQYLGRLPDELEEWLPFYTEDSFPGVLTNVIAGRIANRLDLGGVNYTVDAACASALAALDAAVKELTAGGSDLVICGGADLHNGINDYLLFSSVRALSPSGRSRPFAAGADGIALGEAVACVVLKRRTDAERDGDRIYAVIDALGGSSDGRHLGLTAPRKEGQRLALRRAYEQAGYGPDRIELVEAHGTGTAVGDSTELATLTETFAEHGARRRSTVLGSVKSQVGHTKCAAGLVGLVKVARAVYHAVLPPTLHAEVPHESWDQEESPFRFLSSAQPWPGGDRRAAVSAFGFGGTNFHALVSAPPGTQAPPAGVGPWPAELVLVRAEDPARARERAASLAGIAARVAASDPTGERHRLRDFAYTLACGGTGGGAVQLAVVARDWAQLAARLEAAAAGAEQTDGVFAAATDGRPETGRGRVAFLFPGQGSQRPGMLGDLFVAFPWLHEVLEAGRPWLDVLFPPAAHSDEERDAQRAAITNTGNAQPTLGLAAAAMTEVWRRLGVRADAMAGHSYGELAALAAAGSFDLPVLLELSAARASAMTGAAASLGDDAGAMAAVAVGAGELRALLAEEGLREAADGQGPGSGVVIANENAPRQSVISGATPAVARALTLLGERGIGARPLPVACAFHSPLVAGGAAQFSADLARCPIVPPSVPVIAGASAAAYPRHPDGVRRLLAEGIASPVRWVEQVEALYAAGVRVFVEVGPGRVLTRLVGAILGDRPHLAVASDVPGEHGITRLLTACASLAAAGVEVDPEPLFAGRAAAVDVERFPLPSPSWTVDGHLVRQADGSIAPGALRPADTVPAPLTGGASRPVVSGGHAGVRPADREATVLGYLESVRDAISAQRDVVLRYLGDNTPLPAALDGSGENRSVTAPLTPDAASAPAAGSVVIGGAHGAMVAASGAVVAASGPAAAGDGAEGTSPNRLDVAALLTAIVSDRTGYPASMLDPEADLEADLSIDSIKRLEILSELMERTGMAGSRDDDSVIEEVAKFKTLGRIAEWMNAHGLGAAAEGSGSLIALGPSPEPTWDVGSPATGNGHRAPTVGRWEIVPRELGPTLPATPVAGRRVVVAVHEGSPVADALAAAARRAGAQVRVVAVSPWPAPADPASLRAVGEADVVVYLGALEREPGDAPSSFPMWQAALAGKATRWVGVTVDGGLLAGGSGGSGVDDVRRPAGLAGLLKVAAHECPGGSARCVDLDGAMVVEQPERTAQLLLAEIEDASGPVDVSLTATSRSTTATVALPPLASRRASVEPWLGPGSVVLLTGGGRGVTAAVARGIHARFGCRLELIGRSAIDVPEDPLLEGARDLSTVRRRLSEAHHEMRPARIDAVARAVLARRQVRDTLGALCRSGADAVYHSLDVTDGEALDALLTDIQHRRGRIDVVVHGAGVLDDRLIDGKDPARFATVYATKVDAASVLVRRCRAAGLVVFFGSISGVFGNRGQVDYAAANEALDALARAYDHRGTRRVLGIDWGPWGGTGMVTDALARDYARRGIPVIDVAAGVEVLLDVLADAGAVPTRQVVMAGDLPAPTDGYRPSDVPVDGAREAEGATRDANGAREEKGAVVG